MPVESTVYILMMILSKLADVDSRLSIKRGDGNQHPPLNFCCHCAVIIVIPALVSEDILQQEYDRINAREVKKYQIFQQTREHLPK